MTNDANPAPSRVFDAAAYLADLDARGEVGDTVPTGFPSVDAKLGGGPRRGDLVVLAGDAGCGKSALAMAMAVRVAAAGEQVAWFSGESSPARLIERSLALLSRTPVDILRNGKLDEETHARVGAAALQLRDRSPGFAVMPPNGVGGLSDLLIEEMGTALVVVDPVQSLLTGRLGRDEELAHVVRELKGMALRRNCTILLVSGLTHAVRERPDARPRLDDLGALGTLAQHADIVMGLFREELYHPSSDIDGAAELHVLKQRNGPAGWVDLYFYKRWLRFEDMVEG